MFLYLIADPKSSEQGKSALFGELKKLKSTLLLEQDKPSTSVKPSETNTKTQAGELVEEHWSVSEVYHVFRSWTITISDTNCPWIYRIPLNLSLSQCLSSSTAPKMSRDCTSYPHWCSLWQCTEPYHHLDPVVLQINVSNLPKDTTQDKTVSSWFYRM